MRATLISIFLFGLAAPAGAQEAEFQGNFTDWTVHTRGAGDELVCYVLTEPADSAPRNVDHGENFFLIATWRSGAATEQPNFAGGYALREDSPPRARVGSDRFDFFVAGEEAFIHDADEERRLVAAMRKGSLLRLEAVSDRGTATTYEFSLSGVTAALRRAAELCG